MTDSFEGDFCAEQTTGSTEIEVRAERPVDPTTIRGMGELAGRGARQDYRLVGSSMMPYVIPTTSLRDRVKQRLHQY